jgi:hypothetical protein
MGDPAPIAMGSVAEPPTQSAMGAADIDPIPAPTGTTAVQGQWVAGGIGRAMPAPTNRPPASTKSVPLMGRPAMRH